MNVRMRCILTRQRGFEDEVVRHDPVLLLVVSGVRSQASVSQAIRDVSIDDFKIASGMWNLEYGFEREIQRFVPTWD